MRPKVPLVSKPLSSACRAERLARATPGPYRTVVGPPGEPQGVAPDADAGEEVALRVTSEVSWSNIAYVSLVYVAWRDEAGGDQISQPLRSIRVDLVVVGRHRRSCSVRRWGIKDT